MKATGEPRQLGYQYGTLLAAEIDDAHQAVRHVLWQNTQKPWTWFRDEARRMFWPALDEEYRQELQGQADALVAKGFRYDVWDVLAFNAYIELEGYYIPYLAGEPSNKEACSAFVATGSATKDGKPVMGHNLWWDYLVGQRFNVVLELHPAKGSKIVMDTLPGFIHSGSDFAISGAGIMVCETTISGFKGFDPKGIPEFMRMRKATQYATDLDSWAAIMRKGNNGGYANTWLLADIEENEIGKLELGLKNVIFHRSKDGYYVGSNFPEDDKLIREETNGWNKDPKRNSCEARRVRWNKLLTDNKGAVDSVKAQGFLADTYDEMRGRQGASDATLCGRGPFGGAVNTKVATADMAKQLTFDARMGFSDGSTMKFPNRTTPLLRDIGTQPWVRFTPSP